MAKKEVKNNKDKTSFMKSFKAELKKVVWPTKKQLINSTLAVLAIVLVTAMIVFVLDFAFESMNKYGLDKIKEVVSNSSYENNVIENETTDESNSIDEDNSSESDEETETEIQEVTDDAE